MTTESKAPKPASIIAQLTLAASALLIIVAMAMAFLAVRSEGLVANYAFASIVGLLIANIVVGLGRLLG